MDEEIIIERRPTSRMHAPVSAGLRFNPSPALTGLLHYLLLRYVVRRGEKREEPIVAHACRCREAERSKERSESEPPPPPPKDGRSDKL